VVQNDSFGRLLIFDDICVCNAKRRGSRQFSVSIRGETVRLVDIITTGLSGNILIAIFQKQFVSWQGNICDRGSDFSATTA
jgi:hypothetical protein